jgi:hypothetical protein
VLAVALLVLSNPTVTSGTVAAGQTVTMQITLTDTDQMATSLSGLC